MPNPVKKGGGGGRHPGGSIVDRQQTEMHTSIVLFVHRLNAFLIDKGKSQALSLS